MNEMLLIDAVLQVAEAIDNLNISIGVWCFAYIVLGRVFAK